MTCTIIRATHCLYNLWPLTSVCVCVEARTIFFIGFYAFAIFHELTRNKWILCNGIKTKQLGTKNNSHNPVNWSQMTNLKPLATCCIRKFCFRLFFIVMTFAKWSYDSSKMWFTTVERSLFLFVAFVFFLKTIACFSLHILDLLCSI